jgi:hypothetical protein
MTQHNINKGTRIKAQWFNVKPSSLTGMQLKFSGKQYFISGIVRHVRVDDLINPTKYYLYVESDNKDEGVFCEKCKVNEVFVDPKHVIEVDCVATSK